MFTNGVFLKVLYVHVILHANDLELMYVPLNETTLRRYWFPFKFVIYKLVLLKFGFAYRLYIELLGLQVVVTKKISLSIRSLG